MCLASRLMKGNSRRRTHYRSWFKYKKVGGTIFFQKYCHLVPFWNTIYKSDCQVWQLISEDLIWHNFSGSRRDWIWKQFERFDWVLPQDYTIHTDKDMWGNLWWIWFFSQILNPKLNGTDSYRKKIALETVHFHISAHMKTPVHVHICKYT